MKGKLIAIYGVNNLGKTFQARKLVKYLKQKSINSEYIKFPFYANNSGKLINNYLRSNNPDKITKDDFDILQIINKYEVAHKIEKLIQQKKYIVAEDYILTGIAWAMANSKKPLSWYEFFYRELRQPDKAVLLDGKRFTTAREENHKYEKDDELTKKAKFWHRKLAKKYGYPIVNANQSRQEVHREIVDHI